MGRNMGHLSNEKNPSCLGYIGDEILHSYMGIILNHCKDPYQTTDFFRGSRIPSEEGRTQIQKSREVLE